LIYKGLGPIPPIFVCLGLCVLSGAFAVIFMNSRIKKEMKRNLESTIPPTDIELATTTDNTTNTNTTNSND
jgi:flagellar basal body-associated protein FliL